MIFNITFVLQKSQTGANQLINHFITSSHQTVKYIMLLQFENPLPFIVANHWTPMALYKKMMKNCWAWRFLFPLSRPHEIGYFASYTFLDVELSAIESMEKPFLSKCVSDWKACQDYCENLAESWETLNFIFPAQHNHSTAIVVSSDEFELEFPELSRAEL